MEIKLTEKEFKALFKMIAESRKDLIYAKKRIKKLEKMIEKQRLEIEEALIEALSKLKGGK